MNIGWSDFARKRHLPGTGHSWFKGSNEELFSLIEENWDKRVVGDGANSVDDVCIVDVDPKLFVGTKILLKNAADLKAQVEVRQAGEDPFVKVTASGPVEKVIGARVVLYAAHELLKNGGKRSGDYDWEIVCLLAQDDKTEPMPPLTMARNFLNKPGGTPRGYSAQEFAESIYYWSQRVKSKV